VKSIDEQLAETITRFLSSVLGVKTGRVEVVSEYPDFDKVRFSCSIPEKRDIDYIVVTVSKSDPRPEARRILELRESKVERRAEYEKIAGELFQEIISSEDVKQAFEMFLSVLARKLEEIGKRYQLELVKKT
jgi:hypothetical protein